MQERMGGGAEREGEIPAIEDIVVQTPKGILPAAEAIGLLQNATALSAGDLRSILNVLKRLAPGAAVHAARKVLQSKTLLDGKTSKLAMDIYWPKREESPSDIAHQVAVEQRKRWISNLS